MPKLSLARSAAAALTLVAAISPGAAREPTQPAPDVEIGYIEIDPGFSLRRMIVRNPKARGTVLLLHGFPETLYAWKHVSLALGDDYEVHAFDWPGFGQSSRPPADRFAYAPRDYARVLSNYIDMAGIDRSKLTIYATDIGGLPALLAAIETPDIASTIIVSDFAPFDRPALMQERLRRLKAKPASDEARAQLNANRDDTLENAVRRGLPPQAQFELSAEFKEDMVLGWGNGQLTSADAFYHYYSHFTRDQQFLEANLHRLKTPVKVVWGADDFYIRKEMGIEFAKKAGAPLTLLPGVGHYAHLQAPDKVIEEIRASAR